MTPTYNGLERDLKTPTHGGYSKPIVCDEKYVLKIALEGSLETVAPLLCAGITTYSPQINEAYERLARADVRYRFVIDTSTL